MAIKRNLIGNFLGQGWVAAMGIIFVPVWVGHLGVEAYALIGFYSLLQGWLALLDFGMTPTMTREVARASAGAHTADSIADLVRSIEVVCFSVAAIIVASVFLGSDWLAQEWFTPQNLSPASIADAIAVMALVIGSRFCEGIYRGALFGMERQLWYNCVNATLATVRYVGAAIIVIWVSPTVEAFFWWQALISLLTVAVFAIATHHWLPGGTRRAKFSPRELRAVAAFAGGLSVTTLLGLLLTHLDKVMLSRLLSMEVFGHYMLAVAISGLFPVLVWPIATAFYPALTVAATTGDESAVSRHYHMATQLAAAVLVPAVAVCCFFPNEIILAWTGNAALASEVGPLLRLLSIGIGCNSLLQFPFALQLAYGWTSLALRINILATMVLLPGVFVATQQFGAIGAASVWAGVNVAILPAAILLMHRRILPGEQSGLFQYGIVLPSAVGLAGAGLLKWVFPTIADRFTAFGVIMTVGCMVFALVAFSMPNTRKTLMTLRLTD